MITILISDHYNLPQIRLDEKIPLHSLTVEPACGFERRDPALRPLQTIDLRGAPIWGKNTFVDSAQRTSLSITWRVLNEQQRLKNTELIADDLFQSRSLHPPLGRGGQAEQGSLLARGLRQPILQLIAAAEQLDSRSAKDAAQNMIGLMALLHQVMILIGFWLACIAQRK